MGSIMNVWKRIQRVLKRKTMGYVPYLRSVGMRIGKGTTIFANPRDVFIDPTRPWLIEIGNDVQITNGVKILTHGYDWSVVKGTSGEVLGSAGKVSIGNNCFIGMNVVILKGTTIGDNVIIGAGSVVRGFIPSNTVAAGNPCRVICSLDEYKQRRIAAQKEEAKELVVEYYKVYGTIPPQSVLSEFFWLFTKRSEIEDESFKEKMNCVRNYDYSMNIFRNTQPDFSSYDSFIDWCFSTI